MAHMLNQFVSFELNLVWIKLKGKLLFNRQQDVRATEIDKVDMHLSFRPGDIVRASVVSFMF